MSNQHKPHLEVVASPHLASEMKTKQIMQLVCLALLPAILASLVFFGIKALMLYLIAIGTCLGAEWLSYQWQKRPFKNDFSWLVTALLLAMSLPVSVPLWYPLVGGVIAIIMAKGLFGGIGKNLLNPALAGRAVLRLVFVKEMSANVQPALPFSLNGIDVVTSPTPLMIAKAGNSVELSQLGASLTGLIAGKTAETSAILLLIGGLFLLRKKVITWQIPISMLVTIAVIALIASGGDFNAVITHLVGGATLLGAFFMATDYCTSPTTSTGELIFGIGCGITVMIFRLFTSLPEGMTFAILLMNLLVPVIDYFWIPKVVGES